MSGRPRLLMEQIDHLIGDAGQKQRLKVIFAVLLGDLSVGSACELMELGETRYYELRQQVLEGALAALSPRPIGRPRAERESPQLDRLRDERSELERELHEMRVREELLLALPRVLEERRRPDGAGQKRGTRTTRVRLLRGRAKR